MRTEYILVFFGPYKMSPIKILYLLCPAAADSFLTGARAATHFLALAFLVVHIILGEDGDEIHVYFSPVFITKRNLPTFGNNIY